LINGGKPGDINRNAVGTIIADRPGELLAKVEVEILLTKLARTRGVNLPSWAGRASAE